MSDSEKAATHKLYEMLGEFLTQHLASNELCEALDTLYRKWEKADHNMIDYHTRWVGCARDASIHQAERDEIQAKLDAVLTIPHFAPDNSWAAGNSAEEAGWSYAIRAVRKAAGSPIPGYDSGMRDNHG